MQKNEIDFTKTPTRNHCQEYVRLIAGTFPGDLPNPYRFLMQYGRVWPLSSPVAPTDFLPREKKHCYKNCTFLVGYDHLYRYVEGYAIHEDVGIPTQHAWVVDEYDRVFDPTWGDKGGHYFGVYIPTNVLTAVISDCGEYGVFDGGFKYLLRHYYPEGRV